MDFDLRNGDCLEIMKEIPDKSVQLILCDLPYGMTARNKWDEIIPMDKLWIHYTENFKGLESDAFKNEAFRKTRVVRSDTSVIFAFPQNEYINAFAR